jgi:hypothetical protein
VIARLAGLLRRIPARLAQMRGYWGGVIMRGLDRATAFLRR